jgi:hypothetical protein
MEAWHTMSMDFIEGLPKSGSASCILVIVDKFTHYGHFTALSHPYTTSPTAMVFMNEVYRLHAQLLPYQTVTRVSPVSFGSHCSPMLTFSCEWAHHTTHKWMDKLNGSTSASRHFCDVSFTLAPGNGRIGWQLWNSGIIQAFTRHWVGLLLKLFMVGNFAHLVLNLTRCLGASLMTGCLREPQQTCWLGSTWLELWTIWRNKQIGKGHSMSLLWVPWSIWSCNSRFNLPCCQERIKSWVSNTPGPSESQFGLVLSHIGWSCLLLPRFIRWSMFHSSD